MNLTESIAPKSDQINADDLMSGPITVTIKEVRKGSAEQPVDVILEEYPGRCYRPSKSMRRVMVAAWGVEASDYTGHKLTLFRNPEIAFGGMKLGGVEIAAMSHVSKPITIALTTTRSKRKNFTVAVLPDAPTPPRDESGRDWLTEIAAVTTTDALTALYKEARETPGAYTDELHAAFAAVGAAIKAASAPAEEGVI